MTPDQIQILTALAAILKTVGTLPFGLVLTMLICGPWLGMLIVIAARGREDRNTREKEEAKNDQILGMITAQDKRFEKVVSMYENNVILVKDYQNLSSDLTGIITLSTRTLEALIGKIDNNHFCPIMRKELGKG